MRVFASFAAALLFLCCFSTPEPAPADATTEQFWVNVRRLRLDAPPRDKVVVELVDELPEPMLGRVLRPADGTALVQVRQDLSMLSRAELEHYVRTATLVHEWGHALTPPRRGTTAHGPAWGVHYAESYRVIFGR